MTGTIVNAGAVIAGSLIGLLIKSKLPERFVTTVFQVIGLFSAFLGISMALNTKKPMILALSLILGALLGEWIQIEKQINRLAEKLKKKIKFVNNQFSEGIITAFLIYCVGSIAILGCIEDGLGKPPILLLTKSMLDGVASIMLAASLGIGVLFSAAPLILFQGAITLSARYAQGFFTESLVNEITAVGGILLIGLGLSLMDVKKLKIINILPALLMIVLFYHIF